VNYAQWAELPEVEALTRIAEVRTLPMLVKLFEAERHGDERPGVMAALKARLAQLKGGG
jgi:hypothetical protein